MRLCQLFHLISSLLWSSSNRNATNEASTAACKSNQTEHDNQVNSDETSRFPEIRVWFAVIIVVISWANFSCMIPSDDRSPDNNGKTTTAWNHTDQLCWFGNGSTSRSNLAECDQSVEKSSAFDKEGNLKPCYKYLRYIVHSVYVNRWCKFAIIRSIACVVIRVLPRIHIEEVT